MPQNNILVINKANTIVPKNQAGPGIYSDLVGSSKSSKTPIVAGIWHVLDCDEPTPAWEADWDEVKYVIAGELVLKNEWTGETHILTAGSLLWIPTGSKMSIVRSKDTHIMYVEQDQRDGEFGTEEGQVNKSTL